MRHSAQQPRAWLAAISGSALFWSNMLALLAAGCLQLLATRMAAQSLLWAAFSVVAVAFLGGLAGGALASRRDAALARLAAEVRQIAAGEIDRAAEAGSPALIDLAQAINALVARGSRAPVAGDEQLAADVRELLRDRDLARLGHDLRSPLNAIMNFTRFLGKERYGTLNERQQELQQRVLASAESLIGQIDALFATTAARPALPLPQTTPAAPQAADALQTIVVIDDDQDSQTIVAGYLEEHGYIVRAIYDSRDAIEHIRQIQPRLVILDVLMPHLDGWEVLAQLKSTPDLKAIPVLICSVVEHQRLASTLGADDYLVKPLDEAALLTRVRRLIAPQATVLVIDDDPDTRRVVRLALEDSPYHLVEAADGRTGLAMAASGRPNLAIIDLLMPGLDGFAAIDQLRADPHLAGLKILLFTAIELSPNEQADLAAHGVYYLRKGSTSAEQLLELITPLMGLPEAESNDRPEGG